MPIGELAMHYAFKKKEEEKRKKQQHILQLPFNWIILKPKIVQKAKYKTQAIPLKFWYRISQLVSANANRSATPDKLQKMFISGLV